MPWNFVARLESLECEDWYVGKIQRSLAEKLVSAHGFPRGTFLVRKRDSGQEYALTINDSETGNSNGNVVDVKHYKIRPLDGNGGYYITTRKVFNSIRELIDYYSRKLFQSCQLYGCFRGIWRSLSQTHRFSTSNDTNKAGSIS